MHFLSCDWFRLANNRTRNAQNAAARGWGSGLRVPETSAWNLPPQKPADSSPSIDDLDEEW